MTRIRVSSTEPPLKAWLSVPSHVATIHDLKTCLCQDVKALQHVVPQSTVLSLDDFELLDNSPINVLRDGDLVTVQCSPIRAKRKATHRAIGTPRKRLKYTYQRPSRAPSRHPSAIINGFPQTNPDTDSSDSSKATTSTSSSDSSSAESTSSDSDSSESNSDTDSLPSQVANRNVLNKKVEPPKVKHTTTLILSPGPPVPPGHGKPATRNRNMRRRRQKQYQRDDEPEPALPLEASTSNAIPLGSSASEHALDHIPVFPPSTDDAEPIKRPRTAAERMIMMSLSLGNKNKKKGFKSRVSDDPPQKIVFSSLRTTDSAETSLCSAKEYPSCSATPNDTPVAKSWPRLVPPSEKQEKGDLPANIFVTSIDVEEGLPHRKKLPTMKRNSCVVDEDISIGEGNVWLNYGTSEPIHDSMPSVGQNVNGEDLVMRNLDSKISVVAGALVPPDWEVIENRWNAFAPLSNHSQLRNGILLGYKALAINPSTLTPEMLLNVARLVGLEGESMTIQPLLRPDATRVSFGGVVEEDEAPMEEVLDFDTAISSGYKIVDV